MSSLHQSDEERPLLRPNGAHDIHSKPNLNAPPPETPLPWAQFSLVLFLQLAEPLTSQVIYPFAPELIRSLGVTKGDDTRVGYYVGLMQSIFFATQALTVLQWSRISDRVGRKPVMLCGLFGLSLSMYCFGLSRTFWGLVLSRSLNGALNGNIGVLKSALGEMMDATNIARSFAYQPLAWSTGATLGPLIGGTLSRPAEKYPHLFGSSEFLKTYPYFLPCAIPATFTIVCWIVTFLFLKETNPTGFSVSQLFNYRLPSTSLIRKHEPNSSKPPAPPLASLLTPRVILAASNYALLSLLDIAYRALQPVYLATPIPLGGPGLSSRAIGYALAVLGVGNGLFQVLCFAPVVQRIGLRSCYLVGLLSAAGIFATFPAMSVCVWLGRNHTTTSLSVDVTDSSPLSPAAMYGLYAVLALQLVLTIGLNTCYGCIFIYINASAKSRRTLGATNGLAQMGVSIMRAIGPAAASALFSLSLEFGGGGSVLGVGSGGLRGAGELDGVVGLLKSWIVYGVMIVLVGVAVGVGRMLPTEPWVRED